MEIKILNTRTAKDPSSYKSWEPLNEFLGYDFDHLDVVNEKFSQESRDVVFKMLKKIERIGENHNNLIRLIDENKKLKKRVAEIRMTTDLLEADFVIEIEILNEYLIDANKNRKAA